MKKGMTHEGKKKESERKTNKDSRKPVNDDPNVKNYYSSLIPRQEKTSTCTHKNMNLKNNNLSCENAWCDNKSMKTY